MEVQTRTVQPAISEGAMVAEYRLKHSKLWNNAIALLGSALQRRRARGFHVKAGDLGCLYIAPKKATVSVPKLYVTFEAFPLTTRAQVI